MLEVFTTSDFDNKIAVINENKIYSFKDLKELIANQLRFIKGKKENIVILSGDNFSFIINFFASVFAGKNIYLMTDKTRLNDINFEYSILENINFGKNTNTVLPEVDLKTTLINFYTSGSSGKPKTIKKSLYNLIEEGNDLSKEFGIKEDLTVMSTTTMCHLFGMTFHLMFSLCNRLTIDTTPISYPENINSSSSILVSTPAFLSTKIKHNLSFTKPPKYIISAGSKLDEKVFELLERDSKIIEIYGSTESGVIAYKTKNNKPFKIFPNVKIEANNENANIYSNYIYNGSCIINDKIELLGDKLVIKNRTDRLFKIYDKRISAVELENKLNSHEFVENSYIMNFENKLVCLCALSKSGKKFLLSKNIFPLIKTLKLHMFKYSEIIPQKWKFIDQIPMNSMGKINKTAIEHLFNVNLSLPIILDRAEEENSITYKIFMYKNCNFFNGHFPEYQIVPGVLQLYLAKEFANAHFNLNLGKGQYKRIKFSNVIEPDSIVNLTLTKKEKQVLYEYYSDKQKYSSGAFDINNIFEGETNVPL